MKLRKILLMAALSVALVGLPSAASAQARGQDRATVASADARAYGRPAELPPGIAKRVENGGTLPPGIARTRPQPEAAPVPEPLPEPEPEPEPEPTPEEPCDTHPVITPTGIQIVDCNGNVVGSTP